MRAEFDPCPTLRLQILDARVYETHSHTWYGRALYAFVQAQKNFHDSTTPLLLADFGSYGASETVGADAGTSILRHYTTSEAAELISASGTLQPGFLSGKIWVTSDIYSTGKVAQENLALPTTPDGFFEIPTRRMVELSPAGIVQPTSDEPGGGVEMTTTSPINVNGLPFQQFGK